MMKIPTIYKCISCGSRQGYNSLEGTLGKELHDAGFPYDLSDFETLSYKKYECRGCGASDRDRLYMLYISKSGILEGLESKDVVDFAPSPRLGQFLKSRPKVIYRSADLYMSDVDDNIDITDMKEYEDNRFDFFVCSHLLEHVSDDGKALSELRRILKPGGKGILMTPIIDKQNIMDEDVTVTDEAERIRRFAQNDHVRLYERSVFIDRVKKSGLKLSVVTWKEVGLVSWLRNGLTLKSKLYVVSK